MIDDRLRPTITEQYVLEADIRLADLKGFASATSVTTCGRDSVSIPSRTVPTCSNNDAISHITQWDIPLSRSAIAPAAATAPTPIAFSVHNISATHVVLMIRSAPMV